MDSPRERFFAGVRAHVPPLVGIVPFGLVAGVSSTTAGLTPLETLAMSIACFSGIVQLVSVQLYAAGAPLALFSPVQIFRTILRAANQLVHSAPVGFRTTVWTA